MAFDPTAYIQEVTRPNGEASPHGRQRLGLIPFDQIRPGKEPPYLVKGLFPREGLTVVWGPPKSGKSFQTFDLVMSVVRGLHYRGRRVQQGTVVYCAAEGATGFRNRVEAYRRYHEIDGDLPFFLVPDSLKLQMDDTRLIESIRATLGDNRPSVVVLDTLNRSMDGDENSPADMGAYIKSADAIREAFECAVIVVHHCGTEGKRPRGHTSLTGAVDAQLAVKRGEDGTICTEVEWMKDGPEGEAVCSRLEVVTVGNDEDGNEITSCVVIEAEEAAIETHQKADKLTANQRTMLTILEQAQPNGLTVEVWNAEAREIDLCGGRKQRLYDLRMQLKDKKRVHEYGGRWYVTNI